VHRSERHPSGPGRECRVTVPGVRTAISRNELTPSHNAADRSHAQSAERRVRHSRPAYAPPSRAREPARDTGVLSSASLPRGAALGQPHTMPEWPGRRSHPQVPLHSCAPLQWECNRTARSALPAAHRSARHGAAPYAAALARPNNAHAHRRLRGKPYSASRRHAGPSSHRDRSPVDAPRDSPAQAGKQSTDACPCTYRPVNVRWFRSDATEDLESSSIPPF